MFFFCRDFNINFQSTLHQYMEKILTCWHGNSCYEQRIKEVMCKVVDVNKICQEIYKILLNKVRRIYFSYTAHSFLLMQVSWYDYHRIDVILQLLLQYDYNPQDFSLDLGLELLNCLRSYIRISSLLTVEEEWWRTYKSSSKVHYEGCMGQLMYCTLLLRLMMSFQMIGVKSFHFIYLF